MENKVKVSVIIPVYNTEKYVEKCINSVLNQTLKEIEVIIINDGSTDNSLEIINKFSVDERIKIISRENKGASKTRNEGLNLSKGKYLYYLDSDDYLEGNDALESLYKKCEDENLDIVIFDYYKVEGNSKKYITTIQEKECINKVKNIYNMIDFNGCSIWCKMIKKELYLKNGIKFLEEIFLSEDWNISIKLASKAKKIGKIDKAFYNYIQHNMQGTKNIDIARSLKEEYKSSLDLINFLSNDKENNKYIKAIKLKLYYNYLKKRYKNLEYYKILKENFMKEDKKGLYDSEYYKKWILKNKIKFWFRSKSL